MFVLAIWSPFIRVSPDLAHAYSHAYITLLWQRTVMETVNIISLLNLNERFLIIELQRNYLEIKKHNRIEIKGFTSSISAIVSFS